MASKAKAKALADDFDDDEVASMLELDTPVPPDPEQWVRDENGDLDWAYTSRTVRKLSHDALLTHLWEKSFSIPPREYNPSAPFVWVKLHSGDTVRLPHGYRLPLMFVAKYRWEMTLAKVTNERVWKQERANIFHLSRLCENLFRRAQAKASRGGMEKGWRCVMFDRLLARFYKHWARNDPEGGKGFLKTHGSKEYDRDVLKHDWKRWCLRGLNGVRMIEEEVTHGISIENFRKGLRKTDDGVWMLDDQALLHITDEEPQAYSSSSDLTDFSGADGNPSDDEGEGDEAPDEAASDAPDDDVAMQTDTPADAHPKRPRDLPVDDDEIERETKRTRIENHLEAEDVGQFSASYYAPARIGRLTRTLAAMARNPVWANSGRSALPSTSHGSSELNPATRALAASESGPSGTATVPPPPPPASTESQPENPSEEAPVAPPDLSSLATVDPSLLVASTKRVRHASQDREDEEGSSRLEPIYIPTPSFFTSTRADKYPWPPALGLHEPRSHSELRMFQECTAPDTWELDDGSIAWRAAGTLAWSDEKVWRAAAAAATSEEALRLAQAAASTGRPSRAASMKSRQLTKAASRNPLSGRSMQRMAQPGKARERDRDRDRDRDREKEKDKDEREKEGEKEKEKERDRDRRKGKERELSPLTTKNARARGRTTLRHPLVSSRVVRLPTPSPMRSRELSPLTTKNARARGRTTLRHPLVSSRVVRHPTPSPMRSQSSLSSLSTPTAKTPGRHQLARRGNTMDVDTTAMGTTDDVPQGGVHAKALELLVNMLDVKQVLAHSFTAAAVATGVGAASSSSAGNVAERAREEKAALDGRLQEFEDRFTTMKEELTGIVGRLQVLEAEAERLPERLVALRQEEEEGEEEEVVVAENWADFMRAMHRRGAFENELEVEVENEEVVVEQEIEAEKPDEEPNVELEAPALETPAGEGADAQPDVPGEADANTLEKPAEQETDDPQENEKDKAAENDQDVDMDEAVGASVTETTTTETTSAVTAEPPPQRTYGEISIQTDLIEETPPPPAENEVPAEPQPQEESSTDEVAPEKLAQPEDTQTTTLEETQAPMETQATPTPSEHSTPRVPLQTVDPNHQDAHQHDSSEPDTDITMVNATTSSSSISSSSLMKEDPLPLDPRTREISSNLSLLVDSLVSAKMLAVMEGMVKTRVAEKEGEAGKEKEAIKEGSVTSSATDVPCEHTAPPPPHPLLRDSTALVQSPDSYAVAQLLEEVRNMQKQSQLREQREKEELQAMRELHSAEVDALRRRLSYLETQNRHSDAGSAAQPTASSSMHPHYPPHPPQAERSYHPPHPPLHPHPHPHAQGPPREGDVDMENTWQSRQQRYGSAPYQYPNVNGNGHGAQSSASPVEPEPPAKEPPPVRLPTDRSFTFRIPGKDRDDEVPLPIKSQRKQYIVFPRAQYG